MPLLKFLVFHPWRALTMVVLGGLLGLGSFYAYQLASAFASVASEDFDPAGARAQIAAVAPGVAVEEPSLELTELPGQDLRAELDRIEEQTALAGETVEASFNLAARGEPIPDEVFDAYLLVGTDASGFLADAIILGLQPTAGGAPIMVSLPRDLYVWNACKQSFTRLNTGLGGCRGTASGSELLAIMVEDYTGIPIDHLARINFDGFARLVDVMGGIEVCVDRPTRDLKAHLLLETTGCRPVDGATALAWVRSRQPEHLVDGEWRAAGGSDFTRQRHQQDVLFQLAARSARFSSPGALADRLSAVASSVRFDSGWSLAEAVAAAWRYRGISPSEVRRFAVEVRNHRTPSGAAVLLPTVPFRTQLEEVYPLS